MLGREEESIEPDSLSPLPLTDLFSPSLVNTLTRPSDPLTDNNYLVTDSLFNHTERDGDTNIDEDADENIDEEEEEEEEEDDDDDDDDLKLLFKRWLDERMAPNLLPHDHQLVSNVVELLDNQRALLKERRLDNALTSTHAHCIYQLEIERVRYVLSSYLRARLWKIETYWLYWGEHPELRETLFSPPELEYYRRFEQGKRNILFRSVLSQLPTESGLQQIPSGVGPRPSENAHVIVRVQRDSPLAENIIDPDQQLTQRLVSGDIYVLKWKAAAPLWAEKLIDLV